MRIVSAGAAMAITVLLLWSGPSALAASTWESRQVEMVKEADSLLSVSCPTPAICVAVGTRGTIVTSTNPGAGASAWRRETVAPGAHVGTGWGAPDRTSPGAFESVSCPTITMCAAVTFAGDFYASGDPQGGAVTWRATDLDGDGADTNLRGVSCPDPTFCVALAAGGEGGGNEGGRIFAIHNPLTASIGVVPTQLPGAPDLQSVSCPSLELCIGVASGGRILVSTNPSNGAPIWRDLGTPGGPGDLEAVECPDSSLCLAGNAAGNVLSSTNPTASTPDWRKVNTGPSVPITGISCPTPSRCAAVDNNGDVVVSRDPTGPLGSWTVTNLIPFPPAGSEGRPFNAFFGISCPTADFCAAVASQGKIFTSVNPFDVDETRPSGQRRGPQRPRMRIVRHDHFAKQASTRGAGSRVTFRLRPYGRARGFLCSLDRRRFRPCRSPLRIYTKVGTHMLRAKAIGATGLRGPVARHRFAIRNPNR